MSNNKREYLKGKIKSLKIIIIIIIIIHIRVPSKVVFEFLWSKFHLFHTHSIS